MRIGRARDGFSLFLFEKRVSGGRVRREWGAFEAVSRRWVVCLSVSRTRRRVNSCNFQVALACWGKVKFHRGERDFEGERCFYSRTM